jgi:hypothetical protein
VGPLQGFGKMWQNLLTHGGEAETYASPDLSLTSTSFYLSNSYLPLSRSAPWRLIKLDVIAFAVFESCHTSPLVL